LNPSTRTDKILTLRRAAVDIALNGDTFPSLDEDLSAANVAAESVKAGVEPVVEQDEFLVVRPELGDSNIRVRVEGDGNCALIVVIGVVPHRSFDCELAVDGVILSLDSREARVRHDDCVE
jgi:hypothetical protein